jgi:predicted DNA-binding transcriptional regulator YafY
MLKLLSLLQVRRDWPGSVLAERLEVSDRTLRRDVDRLRKLGYRISAVKGPDGGYRLDAGSELPPLLFDDDQAIALAIALQVAAVSGAAASEAALRALSTVRQVMPARLRRRIDSVAFTALPTSHTTSVTAKPEVLIAINTAVRAREVLRFSYVSVGRSAEAEPSRKHVEPHHIVFSGGRWYLVGWDLNLEDWSVFRIDRMTPHIPTGPRFTPRTVPGGNVQDFLAARFKGSERGNAWPCTGTVVLELPAHEVVPFVSEGTVEDVGPGHCRLTIGSWSWVALAASIARLDATITHASPRELVDAFRVLSARFRDAAHTAVD